MLDDAVDEYLRHGIIRRARSHHPPSGSLFPILKSRGRTALIFDLRSANALSPVRAPRTRFARLSDLHDFLLSPHSHRPSSPRFFTRIDISRFYDSLILPPDFRFYFTYRGVCYRYLRLPFGWHIAPDVGQRVTTLIVRAALSHLRPTSPCRVFVYADDVFCAGDSSTCVHHVTSCIVESLRRSGLVVNEAKSILDPAPSLTLLGHRVCAVSSAAPITHPLAPSLPAVVRAALSARLTRRRALAVAGSLLWCSPRVLPFLQPLYAHLLSRPRPSFLPRAVRDATLHALTFATSDVWRASVWRALPHPTTPPPATLFCDASARCRRGAVVEVSGQRYLRCRLPLSVCDPCLPPHASQQLAELYVLVRAVSLALRLFPASPVCIVSDSASALHAALRLSSGAFSPARAALLRSLASALSRSPHSISLAYIRSHLNPADPLTHTHYSFGEIIRRLSPPPLLLPPPSLPPRPALRPSSTIVLGPSRRRVRFSSLLTFI